LHRSVPSFPNSPPPSLLPSPIRARCDPPPASSPPLPPRRRRFRRAPPQRESPPPRARSCRVVGEQQLVVRAENPRAAAGAGTATARRPPRFGGRCYIHIEPDNTQFSTQADI
uniref:Uncharacterized protein n=1 Tax=Leersia perrieri TaxID=77586 RepID=A0A0D9WSB5_9ORYZ